MKNEDSESQQLVEQPKMNSQAQIAQLEQQNEENERTIRRLRLDLASMENRFCSERNAVQEVQKLLDEEIAENEQAQAYAADLQEEVLARFRADTHHKDDYYFTGAVTLLRNLVISYAYDHKLPAPAAFGDDLHRIIHPDYSIFKSVTFHFFKYLHTEDERSTLLQAYIWKFLVDEVINPNLWMASSSHGLGHGGNAGFGEHTRHALGTFKPAAQAPIEDHKTYHFWRCETARMIRGSINRTHLASTIPKIAKKLIKPLNDVFALTSTRLEVSPVLLSIIEKAHAIAEDMACQRAYYHFQFTSPAKPDEHLCYNLASMDTTAYHVETITTRQADEYQFMAGLDYAPGLAKMGSSSGTGFDIKSWLVKKDVEFIPIERKEKRKRSEEDEGEQTGN